MGLSVCVWLCVSTYLSIHVLIQLSMCVYIKLSIYTCVRVHPFVQFVHFPTW